MSIFSKSRVVHREVIELNATPEQVREFITDPERILDYYPDPIDGGVIEAGSAIYCRGKSGVSLLEVVDSESTQDTLVIKVTTASKIDPPFTADKITAAALFSMIEDWQIEAMGQGTRLTKTWRDIDQPRLKFLPMRWMVRKGARAETPRLKAAWDAASKG